jgi:hypothetical protein
VYGSGDAYGAQQEVVYCYSPKATAGLQLVCGYQACEEPCKCGGERALIQEKLVADGLQERE